MDRKAKKFLIIDANAVVHRAYHALPPLKTKTGEIVNAVYGFCLIFLKALNEIKPDFVAACFDVKGPTLRHEAFKEYKAKRKKGPDELYQQIKLIKEVLDAFSVGIFERQGFEADDLIGTLARKAKEKQAVPKIENIILTGDMDALQLVDSQTKVLAMRTGLKDLVLFDQVKVKEKYSGLLPEQLQDYRALRGDPSDNIPGVTGIGEKTAISLLLDFKTLENLYQKIEQGETESIKPSVLQKLIDYKEQAFMSKSLAEIQQNVDINFSLSGLRFGSFNKEKVADIFKKFEFNSLAGKYDFLSSKAVKKEEKGEAANQGVLQEINQLEEQGAFSKQIAQLERDLIEVISEMEKWGIKIDKEGFAELSDFLQKQITKLEKDIYQRAGQEFNINSPKQLSDILFSKLDISTLGLKRTPGGAISTSADSLGRLQNSHPIIKLILEYRELFKLKSGFVDPLPLLADKSSWRIHPNFHQLGAETGRLSCSEPNLQNIPVKGELGKEIRACFVAEKGFLFLSADYSQMDLRAAAIVSGDKKMQEAFLANQDFHLITASEIFEKPKEKISKDERDLAKRLNFGVMYGMGPMAFAMQAGIETKQAKEFISRYFAKFNGLKEYFDKVKTEVAETGFCQTLFGRKRFLMEIHSSDLRMKAQAERMALNMPVQGLSADIIKMAMVALHKQGIINNDCRLLLQIHDELLFEIKKDILFVKAKTIKQIMENAVKLALPMRVALFVGNNWGEMSELAA